MFDEQGRFAGEVPGRHGGVAGTPVDRHASAVIVVRGSSGPASGRASAVVEGHRVPRGRGELTGFVRRNVA
jgi:hypothetical protein